MRVYHRLGLLALGSAIPLAAQTSCTPNALGSAAKAVAAVRHQLHSQAVPESDPNIPAPVAGQLAQLKGALAGAAEAAFGCTNGAATAEQMQKILADALHANLASAAETVTTRSKQDLGAYGSDLSVQTFQLFGRPKFVEVDFRYGVECGDDNLIMVFEAADDRATSSWRERLRWDAPSYATVGDALGDFVMLTPLTGSYKAPSWRFIVAHGHPGCGKDPRPSHFDLDLLSPTTDPRKPVVDWHFDHDYTEDHTVPRLATTEDTVDFRIVHEKKPGRLGTPPQPPEIFRFHLTSNGELEPAPAGEGDDSTNSPVQEKAPPATTN